MRLKDIFKKKNKDPFKEVKVGNYSLTANAEHRIEEFLTVHRYYSRNLPRIASIITKYYPKYSIVDVGANIGDTVALLRSEGVEQPVYAIEGEPQYFNLLKKNLSLFNNVHAIETFLGEKDDRQQFGWISDEGTSKISDQGDKKIQIKKLDTVARENSFENVKLLKTDTDGFDFKILRGATELIAAHKPVLFFEYDADFLEEQHDDGLSIFSWFEEAGYNSALFYDNFGKLLICLPIANKAMISQLYNYMRGKKSAFPYYDVALFHKDDEAMAQEVLASETQYFANN